VIAHGGLGKAELALERQGAFDFKFIELLLGPTLVNR